MKTIIILSTYLIIISTTLTSCSTSNSTESATNNPMDFASFEYSGVFMGSFSSGGSSSPIEGYVTIDSKGAILLDLLSGRMTGTVLKTGTTYNISITESSGIFRDVTNIKGTIEISNRI